MSAHADTTPAVTAAPAMTAADARAPWEGAWDESEGQMEVEPEFQALFDEWCEAGRLRATVYVILTAHRTIRDLAQIGARYEGVPGHDIAHPDDRMWVAMYRRARWTRARRIVLLARALRDADAEMRRAALRGLMVSAERDERELALTLTARLA